MAFVDAGYDGTVDEVQFANMIKRYAVVGADDFKASNTTGDRMLSVANGTALGPGTLNVGTAFSPIQFDAVTSGTTRWDLVVLRRDWQPPGGNTSIAIIKGGATKVLPARNQTPGVIDDQPLYLQQVNAGSTSLGARVDLRVWLGPGGAEAADTLALTYLSQPGAAVKIGGTTHRFELQGNGVWGWSTPYAEYSPLSTSAWTGEGSISVEDIGSRKRVTVDMLVRRSAGQFMVGTSFVPVAALIPPQALGTAVGKYLPLAVSGGGQNILAMGFLNTTSGIVSIRGIESFLFLQNSFFSVNCTYFI